VGYSSAISCALSWRSPHEPQGERGPARGRRRRWWCFWPLLARRTGLRPPLGAPLFRPNVIGIRDRPRPTRSHPPPVAVPAAARAPAPRRRFAGHSSSRRRQLPPEPKPSAAGRWIQNPGLQQTSSPVRLAIRQALAAQHTSVVPSPAKTARPAATPRPRRSTAQRLPAPPPSLTTDADGLRRQKPDPFTKNLISLRWCGRTYLTASREHGCTVRDHTVETIRPFLSTDQVTLGAERHH
jgi:hypothetical protein